MPFFTSKAFSVLEWETQEFAECEPVLVVYVDGQTVVDHSSWGVLDDGVGQIVAEMFDRIVWMSRSTAFCHC